MVIIDVELFNRAFEIDYLKDKKVREELCSMICSTIEKKKFSELKVHKLGYVLVWYLRRVYRITLNVL